MTGVASEGDLQAVEASVVRSDGTSGTLTLVTWPGVTAEQQNKRCINTDDRVACECDLHVVGATTVASIGRGSTIPVSMLLPQQMLTCGCYVVGGQVGWVV